MGTWVTLPNAPPSPYKYKGAPVNGLNYMLPDRNISVMGTNVGQYSQGMRNVMGQQVETYGANPTATALSGWAQRANKLLPKDNQSSYGLMPSGPSELMPRAPALASLPYRPNFAGKAYIMPHTWTPGAQAINPEREQDYVWDKVHIGGKKGFGWGISNLLGAGLSFPGVIGTQSVFGHLLGKLPGQLGTAAKYIGGAKTVADAVRTKGRNVPGLLLGGISPTRSAGNLLPGYTR